MTIHESTEDPMFKADFNSFTQAGAPPELVALMAPLLRSETNGGSEAANRAAGQFLHQQSLGGVLRDPSERQLATAQAEQLLARFGQKSDPAIMRRYAPSDAAVNEALDERSPLSKGDPIVLEEREANPGRAW